MPPQIDPNGPYRRWYNLEPITSYYLFTESDIVWWTQSNPDFATPPNSPGTGINESLSDWDYAPRGAGDPSLVVEYNTYNNRRYGKFIFPASFLNNGSYTISCSIVDDAGQNAFIQEWDVQVNNS